MKYFLLSIMLFVASSTYGGSFVIGMEDNPVLGDNDYNDLVATLFGDVQIHTTGVFSALTTSTLHQAAPIFWNNSSLDGPDRNIGDNVLGTGGFSGGPILASLQYLSSGAGADVSFYFTGSATISVIGGITGGKDALGVCPLVNCNASNTTWIDGTLNYSSNEAWQLTSTNIWKDQSFSDAEGDDSYAFALFQSAAQQPAPEPGTIGLIAASLAVLAVFKARRR